MTQAKALASKGAFSSIRYRKNRDRIIELLLVTTVPTMVVAERGIPDLRLVVATVLGTPELRALWEKELGEMRLRIKQMRVALVEKLKAAGVKQDMSFITDQIGMFSYSGLSKEQMVRLRNEFGVYGTDTGRMCVAALNSKNIDYVCQAIAKVVG